MKRPRIHRSSYPAAISSALPGLLRIFLFKSKFRSNSLRRATGNRTLHFVKYLLLIIVAWIAMIINSKYFTKCNVRFPVARRSELERNLLLKRKILRRPGKADEIAAGYELL